ncbi:MAG TPA: nitrophenyl compound nitroreductase subunit ArsF family protein [Verrucomicrobiae bacterium]|nr:nitrophenyl compound nitroreductase subunit ArsF family protein [Verrucomicrobiae bacterium]
MATKIVPIIFVGGFLGAGKTTLLWEAAKLLIARGKRVGLITNDQAPELVDTGFLRLQGVSVGEVAGSCFCCDFAGLVREAQDLRHSVRADALIAEPVGSCTDLSATILQPLKQNFREDFRLAPLTILADPVRLAAVLSDGRGGLHPSAAYIYWKQLEEADLIAVNKSDLITPEERARLQGLLRQKLPETCARFISAARGDGVEPWLDRVLSGVDAGTHIVDVDYDIYAEGEAALGWLNGTYALNRAGGAPAWDIFAVDIMGRLGLALAEERATIGHVKLLLEAGSDHLAANMTRSGEEPSVRGSIRGAPERARLTINARVEMPPERLREVVGAAVTGAAGTGIVVSPLEMRALRPGRPNPTHRYRDVFTPPAAPPPHRARGWRWWLTAALLLFLVAYAGVMISKEKGIRSTIAPLPGQLVADGVVVFYFHGHYRCDSCDRIEQFTREAIAENFRAQMASGAVAWRSVNTDIAGNAHFTEEYQLVTRTVVVVRTRDGTVRSWKKLDRVWDLLGEGDGFKRYIADEVAGYLGGRQ